MPSVKSGKIKYAAQDSLSDPAPSGKQKVLNVRSELWARVDMHLKQIEQECVDSVNLLTGWRKESSFARLDKRKPVWGSFGPNQGNAGKFIDALAGVVYGYMEAIELLDEILGDDSIGRRNNVKNKRQDQASEEGDAEEEAPSEGRQESPASGARQRRKRPRSLRES